ncbi:MAG TPA: hypothetical protein DCM08_09345 [Microscillaceae bacterium]|nr:hypothetical protein [Microscillaceae bacterium]
MYEVSTHREIIFGIFGTAIGLLGMGFYIWFLFYFFEKIYGNIRRKLENKLQVSIRMDLEGDWEMQPSSRGWLVDMLLVVLIAFIQIIVLVSYVMLPFGVFIMCYFFLLNFLKHLFLS